MLPQIRTLSGLTNDVDGVCVAQTMADAGYLALNGAVVSTAYDTNGIAILGAAQIIRIDSVGDDSLVTFTVTGKNENHNTISEDVTGANAGTAATTKYFKTVDSVYASAATADDVNVGATLVGGARSATIACNWRSQDFKVGLGVNISGTLTSSVQQTLDNVMDASITPTWSDTTALNGLSASNIGNIAFPVRGVRLILTAFTSGSATLNYIQSA